MRNLVFNLALVLVIFGMALLLVSVFLFPFYEIPALFALATGVVLLFYPQLRSLGRPGGNMKVKFSGYTIGAVALMMIVFGIIMNVVERFYVEDLAGFGNNFVFWGFVLVVIAFAMQFFREKWPKS